MALTPAYAAAVTMHREASVDYRKLRAAYHAQLIDDAEFLRGQALYRRACNEYDEAAAVEAAVFPED